MKVSRRGKGDGRMDWTLEIAVASAGSEMSAMRTEAPSRAKRMVVSRPMPLERETSSIGLNIKQPQGRCKCYDKIGERKTINSGTNNYAVNKMKNAAFVKRVLSRKSQRVTDLPCRSCNDCIFACEASIPSHL